MAYSSIPTNKVYNINGECYIEQGYYCNYEQNGGVYIQDMNWVSTSDYQHFITQLRNVAAQFAIQQERSKVPQILDELESSYKNPFARDVRFPAGKTFLMLETEDYNSSISQLISAAAFKDRTLEDDMTTPSNVTAAKITSLEPNKSLKKDRNYDDSKTAFVNAIRQLTSIRKSSRHKYDRLLFENHFSFVWFCGEEKCAKKYCPPDCENKRPDNPQYPGLPSCFDTDAKVSLFKLIEQSLEDKNPYDFRYLKYKPSEGEECEKVRDATKLRDVMTHDIQNLAYVAKVEVNQEENTMDVVLYKYDIINCLIKQVFRKQCEYLSLFGNLERAKHLVFSPYLGKQVDANSWVISDSTKLKTEQEINDAIRLSEATDEVKPTGYMAVLRSNEQPENGEVRKEKDRIYRFKYDVDSNSLTYLSYIDRK